MFSHLELVSLADSTLAFFIHFSCKCCSWCFPDMVVDLAHLIVQLLCAVKQSHDKDVCHGERAFPWSKWLSLLSFKRCFLAMCPMLINVGDIKCENVLVTSWNWLYLADFASFKPTYIPDDDPSDFSFFFDTGGRRRCYLAPEVSSYPSSLVCWPLQVCWVDVIGATV